MGVSQEWGEKLQEHDDAVHRRRLAVDEMQAERTPASPDQEIDDGSRTRQPYKKPELMAWGTLGDITRAVGFTGYKDGPTGPRRTRF
jgi:hypothetical protein